MNAKSFNVIVYEFNSPFHTGHTGLVLNSIEKNKNKTNNKNNH
jgi:hypothetical protein